MLAIVIIVHFLRTGETPSLLSSEAIKIMTKTATKKTNITTHTLSTKRAALTIVASIDGPWKKRWPTRLWSDALVPMFWGNRQRGWSIAGMHSKPQLSFAVRQLHRSA